jgi:hypothetical protein
MSLLLIEFVLYPAVPRGIWDQTIKKKHKPKNNNATGPSWAQIVLGLMWPVSPVVKKVGEDSRPIALWTPLEMNIANGRAEGIKGDRKEK